MTPPTGPDPARLSAPTHQPENERQCECGHERREHDDAGCLFSGGHYWGAPCTGFRPAPQQPPTIDSPLIAVHDATADQTQQPPAQEREEAHQRMERRRATIRSAQRQFAQLPPNTQAQLLADYDAANRRAAEFVARGQFMRPAAPPSEADSGGEPWRVGNHYGIHVYCGDRPVATFLDAADAERAVHAHTALAASSGVRGGDDQARERQLRSALAAWLHQEYGQHTQPNSARVDGLMDVLRAAGGTR